MARASIARRAAEWLASFAGELLTAAAFVGGWLLVTVGVAALLPPRVVWPVSLGLLLLSAGGWGLLVSVARHGLYVLTRADALAPPKSSRAVRRVS